MAQPVAKRFAGPRIINKIDALLNSALKQDGHKELRLLVTGKTAWEKESRATLVNGLLGKAEVAKEGVGCIRCTTQVTEYQTELRGVPVTVFDSPGLQDTTGDEDEHIAGRNIKTSV